MGVKMKDFKMMVPENMREEIQQRLFGCGCEWKNTKTCTIGHDFDSIYVEDNIMSQTYDDPYFFLYEIDLPEITLTEFMELTEQKKQSDLDYDSIIDDILNDPEKSEILVTKLFKKWRGDK